MCARVSLLSALLLVTAVPAGGTEVWLSSSGTFESGSMPPADPSAIPKVFYSSDDSLGSLFVWARPDSGKTLQNWALRVQSTDSNILSLSGSSVETFNPVLGNSGTPDFLNIVRWEHVGEPSEGTTELADLQGFTVAEEAREGVGIGPNGTGTIYNDPFYDAVHDTWLLGRIDFALHSVIGQTEIFLEIGAAGFNNTGESSSSTSVVFGASTDTALNGATDRLVSSSTAEAVVFVVDSDFDSDSDVDGADFLTWQRGFGINSGAEHSQGDATGDGIVDGLDLKAWEAQFGSQPPALSNTTSVVVPEPSTAILSSLLFLAIVLFSRGRRTTHLSRKYQMDSLVKRSCFSAGMLIMLLGSGGVYTQNAHGQQLNLVDASPTRNGLDANLNDPITLNFDRAVNPATFTNDSISVYGRWSGSAEFEMEFSNDNQTVTLQPNSSFSAGEMVTVMLSSDLAAADSSTLRSAGYSYQYWTRTRATSAPSYTHLETMTTGVSTRPYAAVATDLNNDGWLDVTVMNEDTADLRVFTNKADGTGHLNSYLAQSPSTYQAGNRVSPVETHDFNNDGNSDIAVANINDDTVSILLGNGDGTYAPQQLISVGDVPRGIAVLDVDGDADMDIVNTNFNSNNLSLMLNNGSGVFSAPVFFDGGVNGERSIMAGDMDNDGISDLVVGGFNDSNFRVLLGNGNGTFAPMPSTEPAGGRTWEIALGDVNGDGNLDVVSSNGFSENGSVVLGSGNGLLQAPTTYDTLNMGLGGNSTPTGTEIADLDGDGDLDWIVSPFGNGKGIGDWLVILNDGNGNYTFSEELDSQGAPAWATMADLDNDGDLDLALVDESDDLFYIYTAENLGGDMDLSGVVDEGDVAGFVQALRDPTSYENQFGPSSTLQGDIDGDGDTDFDDIPGFLAMLPAGVSLFSVPEPTSLVLLLFAVGISASRNRLIYV